MTDTFKTLCKFGNTKLPKTTMIFNMGSSLDCPSKELGLCLVANDCYARPPEKQYPDCLPYRDRQANYWLNTDTDTIINEIDTMLKRKRNKTILFRFNEAGDFYSQECIEKLSKVADFLSSNYGIITYGYSSRADLDFSNASFFCKSSGYDNGNNGKTIVIDKKEDLPAGFVVCPGSCFTCSLCVTGQDIAFIKH